MPSAAPSSGASRSRPRARQCSDLWQFMEFSKRFRVEEVWPAELLAKKPEFKGKTLFDVLYKNGKVNKFQTADLTKVNAKYIPGYSNDESKAFGFYQKGLFEEYAEFGRGHGHDLAPSTSITGPRPALARGGWQGDAVALPRGL